MKKNIFILLSLLLVICSCQEETVPSITISQPEINYSDAGGTQTISFDSNVSWTASVSASWCTITPSSGNESTKSVSVTLSANDTYDARRCILTILGVDISKTITINQNSNLGLTVTQDKYDLSNASTTIEVEIKTNVEYDVMISADWISRSNTRGLTTGKLYFNIAKNDTYDKRDGSITIKQKNGQLASTIKVYQSQEDAIILSKKRVNLSRENQMIEVELKTNVDFEVIIPEPAKKWVSYTGTRALKTETLLLKIAANENYDARSTEIYVKNKATNLQDTLSIKQSQLDALILSSKTENLTSDSQTLEVELKTNVDFEVIIPEPAKKWVSFTLTRALRTETLLLNIAKNEFPNPSRTTEVYVKNKANSLQDTLIINQEKAPDLPTLSTVDAYDISINSAISGGNITNDGGAAILGKGVCWDIEENPTIENPKTENGSGANDFVASITNLNVETNYYVRAYATNRSGTSYGNQISFTTTSTVAAPVITPKGGIYTISQTVTITCDTEGAQIRYTLNGSEPVETSSLYRDAIHVNEGMTIKAKAFKPNWIESMVATESYVFNFGAQLIEGSTDMIQHIDASQDFVFRLNNLVNKSVFFVFTNSNTSNSTNLPQIESNTASMIVAEKSRVFSEPSFVVSGKPSISDFNNDPSKYPMEGMSKPQYLQYAASKTEKYIVGSSEYLYDNMDNPHLSTVRKVTSAHGKNLYVWVADNCWGSESTKKFHITQQMVDALADKFLKIGKDNDIYEWVTIICGEPWGKTNDSSLIPETDDIHIWLFDIDDDNKINDILTAGYFFARDNFLKSVIKTSNEKLLFALDAVAFGFTANGTWDLSHYWPNLLVSTLAHEFTHMIYFYQKNVLQKQAANIAVNEMCAQCVEDLVANKILADGPRGVLYSTANSGATRNSFGRLPDYNLNNDHNLLDWSPNQGERLLNYSKTYALGAYLMRNYGGSNFIKELIQNNSTGVNSIVDAVNSLGGAGLDYIDILQRFGAANLLSDKTKTPSGYRFNTGTWISSNTNGVIYELGSINLFNFFPPPFIFNVLPTIQKPGSNTFYRAGVNLSGTTEWSFEGMSKDTKLTVVIK